MRRQLHVTVPGDARPLGPDHGQAVAARIGGARGWSRTRSRVPPSESMAARAAPTRDERNGSRRVPSPVVPSAKRTMRSPSVNRLATVALTLAVAARRALSMKTVRWSRARVPTTGHPEISDFATKESGRKDPRTRISSQEMWLDRTRAGSPGQGRAALGHFHGEQRQEDPVEVGRRMGSDPSAPNLRLRRCGPTSTPKAQDADEKPKAVPRRVIVRRRSRSADHDRVAVMVKAVARVPRRGCNTPCARRPAGSRAWRRALVRRHCPRPLRDGHGARRSARDARDAHVRACGSGHRPVRQVPDDGEDLGFVGDAARRMKPWIVPARQRA